MTKKRVTRATVRAFINKNRDRLEINVRSAFDGMVDGCVVCNGGFRKAVAAERVFANNEGIAGAWFVGRSRDYFTAYDDGVREGFEVSNSCGYFILAVTK